jgi:hypothetical protein
LYAHIVKGSTGIFLYMEISVPGTISLYNKYQLQMGKSLFTSPLRLYGHTPHVHLA